MSSMDSVSEVESARTATLRRVGRNLVNAQRIELMLKFLLKVNFTAHLAKIKDHFKKHIERISRKTMGALIPELAEIVFSPANSTESTRGSEEMWLASSLKIPLHTDALNAWSKEWEILRTERNRLVHLMVGSVDFNSPEQCRKLDPEPDAQNELFLNGLAFLAPIVTDTQTEIAKLASGEFDFDPPLPDAPEK